MSDAADHEYELVVLVADESMEQAVRTLLEERSADGGFRRPKLLLPYRGSRLLVAAGQNDPGVLRQAHELLRPFCRQCSHALVLFDRHGCGREQIGAARLENEVRTRLQVNGWGDRADVVVLDPELEAWIWNGAPSVDACLGWAGRDPPLRQWLADNGLWVVDEVKPEDPKTAYRRALREVGTRQSPVVFGDLARQVPLAPCWDRAFGRFLEILRRWFPPGASSDSLNARQGVTQ